MAPVLADLPVILYVAIQHVATHDFTTDSYPVTDVCNPMHRMLKLGELSQQDKRRNEPVRWSTPSEVTLKYHGITPLISLPVALTV